jgi:hypothetical protein
MRRASLPSVKLSLGTALVLALALGAAACAAPDDPASDDGTSQAAETGKGGYVYFHGMSHLGFARDAIRAEVGTDGVVTPSLTDAQLQAEPPKLVVDFLAGRQGATVAGYSLGRVPVLRLMMKNAPGMTRVVMIDPTYDGSTALGRGISGAVAKKWLDADESHTLMLVYGDVTRQVGGDTSYLSALADHPRADLCYVPGDHARFRAADMTAALDAADCADLVSRLK